MSAPQSPDPIANALRAALERSGAQLSQWRFGQHRSATLPARAAQVGDLVIAWDDDELTVEVGRLFHAHFTFDGDPGADRAAGAHDAAQRAAEFVRDVMADAVRFRVDFAGERVLGAQAWYPATSDADPPPPEATHTPEYLWSGPVPSASAK